MASCETPGIQIYKFTQHRACCETPLCFMNVKLLNKTII